MARPGKSSANGTRDPLPPGSVIGILGGGQLGRMLAIAAARIGLKTHIYSDHTGPAFDVAPLATVGGFTDLDAIRAFAAKVDAVTYEFENVPVDAAEVAEGFVPVRPGPKALAVAQDRLEEKAFISGLGIPVAPFAAVESEQDLSRALAAMDAPTILKTRRLGYDGKGQVWVAAGGSSAAAKFEAIGRRPAVLERQLAFALEVSVLVVRAASGEVRFYDIPQNRHGGGILRRSAVPAPLPAFATDRAQAIAQRIADALDYVGVLAVEMFYMGESATEPLIVNEIAPRVHNSGHWTLDACAVSQFENHMRAVAGWPLGSTARHSDAVMDNLIGPEAGHWRDIATEGNACLHLYGKNEAREGRKMGHVTRLSPRSG